MSHRTDEMPVSRGSPVALLLLCLLGEREKAVARARSLVKHADEWPGPPGWYRMLLEYQAGMLDVEGLRDAAGRSLDRMQQADCVIGFMQLAQGNRQKACEHFRKAINHGPSNEEWCYAICVLRQMEKAPNWPPSIPLKK
jgi:hypothetical protein